MCLAIPGNVIKVDTKRKTAIIDYGAEKREVGTVLIPDIAVGEYVLVQAKMIVQRIPTDEAKKFLKTLAEHGECTVPR